MKVVILSDRVGGRVAEDDMARRRALVRYNELSKARDAEIRREYDFETAKHERWAADRKASIEGEYALKRSEYERLAADRSASIETEYARELSECERLVADRNASIETEYARARSEYERLAADRRASIEMEYARELSEYERLAADRSASIERETRKRDLLFRRRLRWLPMWGAALAVAAIVAFFLYETVESLESLTVLYDGALSDGYAFRYVMSAFRYSAFIAASSAAGGVILILAFWRLKRRLSRERAENEPPSGNPLAPPQSARLPFVALCLMLAILICVNAYIRSVAFAPEYLYGLGVVFAVFLASTIIMFGTLFAWAAIPFRARGSRRSIASGVPKPSPPNIYIISARYPNPPTHPNMDEIAKRYPKPPLYPNMDEIAKRYPKPPLYPNMDEIAKRYPMPPIRPSMDEIAKRHPEPPRPGGMDGRSGEAGIWRARAERERKLDERLESQLPSDWTSIRGYRGPAGGIDRVIVGPLGVCALAITHVEGRISVNGHSWRLAEYNEKGFRVELTKIADKFGRTPSSIVNQSAKHIESLLANRNLVNRISRGVILAHEKSRVERIQNQPVDIIESPDGLNVDDMFDYRGALAEGAAADEVARLIIEDHEEFNRDAD